MRVEVVQGVVDGEVLGEVGMGSILASMVMSSLTMLGAGLQDSASDRKIHCKVIIG